MPNYAAQQAQFARAQRAYEARCEPDADFEDTPQFEALLDSVWSTPSMLIDAIAENITADYDAPVPNVGRLTRGNYDAQSRPVAELLAVLLNASNPKDIVAAQQALKDAIEDTMRREARAAWERF